MLSVRRANDADALALTEFTLRQVHEGEGAIKGREVVERGIRFGLADETLLLYWVLVDDDDTAVGGASVSKSWSDWNAGFYWWVESMYVSPTHRGQGGMALLINAINEEMQRQNGVQLRLYVNKDNKAAKGAYERCGFRMSVYEVMVHMTDDSDD